MAKQISNTLKDILNNKLTIEIQDKSKLPKDAIVEILDSWKYNLLERKPGKAYITEDGVLKSTDLDLACLLSELEYRGANIVLPTYSSIREQNIVEGQMVVSKENRHGRIIGLVSNEKTFVFSVKIFDQNVMTTDTTGAYRNFSLTDFNGEWYEGWGDLEFLPSDDEKNFISKNELEILDSIVVKNFVHPNRWVSIYGKNYFLTKLLIKRLSEESKYLNSEIKRMVTLGIKYPKSSESSGKIEYPKTTTSKDGVSIDVDTFEVEIDFPEFPGEYEIYKDSSKSLDQITKKRHEIQFKILPKLRFFVRTSELAYYKYGYEKFPSWIKNSKWEKDYVQKGKRIKWNRLVLFQNAVGEQGISIRTRKSTKKEKVNKNYVSNQ